MEPAKQIERLVQLLTPNTNRQPLALNPPATSAQIEQCERGLGRPLPVGLKSIYRQHNGQAAFESTGLLFDRHLCSTTELVNQYEIRKELQQAFPTDEARSILGEFDSDPEQAVQREVFCEDWFPFAVDGSGDQFFIDNSPGPSGVVGQVVGLDFDFSKFYVVADSIERFLDIAIVQYEGGSGCSALSKHGGYPFYVDIAEFAASPG